MSFFVYRSQPQHDGKDAGTLVPNKQMRLNEIPYPVDRYLVESSKQFQMDNIINDSWKPEPALRPEDEIVLRKLHDMLRSTADDLKLLSGELSKFHEPGVQIKSQPTPLDEEFNEKVHIEEIVNAKFHGYKLIDKPLPFSSVSKPKTDFVDKVVNSNIDKPKACNVSVQVTPATFVQKPTLLRNLRMSRPKIVNIIADNVSKVSKVNENSRNNTIKKSSSSPVVSYNEIVYKHIDSASQHSYMKLQKQNMPVINIRSELKQQKIFNFDIAPKLKDSTSSSASEKNVGVIVINHDSPPILRTNRQTNKEQEHSRPNYIPKQTIRKISKISSCESTESSNNVSSSTQNDVFKSQGIKSNIKFSTKSSRQLESSKNFSVSKKQPRFNIEEWRKRLNIAYGQKKSAAHKRTSTTLTTKTPSKYNNEHKTSAAFNNVEYIPYSKLTLGGARISDIEREVTDLPIKTDLKLDPILGKIISSRQNSFDSPKKHDKNTLTTSDENLLQEVLNIEKTVSETLSKKDKTNIAETKECNSSNNSDSNSYVDDFEDDHSEPDLGCVKQQAHSNSPNDTSDAQYEYKKVSQEPCASSSSVTKLKNMFKKSSNLSIKDEVDIFEFVHMINTQETGTQSTCANKISLKETQTSPKNDRSKIRPIHNDLWPTIDSKGEVENLFQLEKDFIKKLILEEYGQIIENDITKPTSSKEKDNRQINVSSIQKNTQTSPARVKSVMTSPTRTKTRTTSPFIISHTINQDTRSASLPDNSAGDRMETKLENDPEELVMSLNLSSPRFSLRLPQNSREVITNLDRDIPSQTKFHKGYQSCNKSKVSSTSSADGDYSSSEISSVGEVKLKRKQRKNRVQLVLKSDISSIVSDHSSESISGEILPLKSEGEISQNHTYRRPNKHKSSDGEMHLGSI